MVDFVRTATVAILSGLVAKLIEKGTTCFTKDFIEMLQIQIKNGD